MSLASEARQAAAAMETGAVALHDEGLCGLVKFFEGKAAALAAALAAERAPLKDALEALRELHDEQNGPPLIRRQDQWKAAMAKTAAVLAKYEDKECC